MASYNLDYDNVLSGEIDGSTPTLITNNEEALINKRVLSYDDIRCLSYVAMQYVTSLMIEAEGEAWLTWEEIDSESTVQDNELYLGNFEGYDLYNGYTLRTLYMTIDNRIIGDTWDNETSNINKLYLMY